MKWQRKIKICMLSFKYLVELSVCKAANIRYNNLLYFQIRNWGDAINPLFMSFLTTARILKIDIDALLTLKGPGCDELKFLGIGSILEFCDQNTVVWGAGIQGPLPLKRLPKKVHAVRGPLTAKVLNESGCKCPEIYGDPALLLPRFYPSKSNKNYRLGIVAHVVDDKSSLLKNLAKNEGVRFISMRNTRLDLIDEITSCENIASSSLHGLIISDAYGIPACWIRVSNKISGGGFKFLDYHMSIGCSIKEPLEINDNTTVRDVINQCSLRSLNIDLNELYESCPYNPASYP